jgi:hypothetical protein
MVNFSGFSYGCVVTPTLLGPYTYNKAAYTDNTYTTPLSTEYQGSGAFECVNSSGGGGGSVSSTVSTTILGTILPPSNEVTAVIIPPQEVI